MGGGGSNVGLTGNQHIRSHLGDWGFAEGHVTRRLKSVGEKRLQ